MGKAFLIVVLLLHGAIHLMGFAKAFDLARIDQLSLPISRPAGLLWLIAALLMVVSAGLLVISPSRWWLTALPALLLSQALIVGAWSDAKAGTVANLILLVPLALTLLDLRPTSFPSQYRVDVGQRLTRTPVESVVTESDLERLPAPVQRYLRRVGVVGQPRVHNLRARFHGGLRSKPDAGWMTFTADQTSFFDDPARLFLIRAAMVGIPFDAYHRFVGPEATMRVQVASLMQVVDAKGPKMDQSETVTMFNDMCVLAPGALVDAPVQWQVVDERTVTGAYTHAGKTVSATLTFDAEGDLVGFVSNDRFQSADGKTYVNLPWSTPLGEYRQFGPVRLAAKGEAAWQNPEGLFTYGRFEIESLEYNVTAP